MRSLIDGIAPGDDMDIESITSLREDEVYPALFGEPGRGRVPMQAEVFAPFGEVEIAPHWLDHGVMEFQPTPTRRSWLYVTSGYSTPWGTTPDTWDPEAESGNGVEFVLEAPEQADWAATRLMSLMAFDMLLSTGQVEGEPLAFHDIVPLSQAVDGSKSGMMKSVVMIQPEHLDQSFQLPSGQVALAEFVGLTEGEARFAGQFGFQMVGDKLRVSKEFPMTIPTRKSVIK